MFAQFNFVAFRDPNYVPEKIRIRKEFQFLHADTTNEDEAHCDPKDANGTPQAFLLFFGGGASDRENDEKLDR